MTAAASSFLMLMILLIIEITRKQALSHELGLCRHRKEMLRLGGETMKKLKMQRALIGLTGTSKFVKFRSHGVEVISPSFSTFIVYVGGFTKY